MVLEIQSARTGLLFVEDSRTGYWDDFSSGRGNPDAGRYGRGMDEAVLFPAASWASK